MTPPTPPRSGVDDEHVLRPVVLDIDGSISRQQGFMKSCAPTVVPARDLHDALRYWSDRQWLDVLRRRFLDHVDGLDGIVLFYGSSDFHNLTWLWLSMLNQPVSVIHFDNHTDWVNVPPRNAIHAGNWVRHALSFGHVAKIVQIGVNGDLKMQIVPPTPTGPLTHSFELFADGRLETYPHSLETATYLGHVEIPPACGLADPGMLTTDVRWNTVRAAGIEALVEGVLARLPTDTVYISIDKDVLRDADCFTNFYRWQQGTMSLDELTLAIALIAQRKTIVAVDVSGDASPAGFGSGAGLGKRLFSLKDRKLRAEMFDDPVLNGLNDASNRQILAALGGGRRS